MKVLLLSLFSVLIVGCTGSHSAGNMAHDMHREHRNDAPIANAATTALDTSATIGSRVNYGQIGNLPLVGYHAAPLNANLNTPAVIMVHEWWGLNDNIKMMARKLAQEGYRVLAVDLYGGKLALNPDSAMVYYQKATSDKITARNNLRQAHAYLTKRYQAAKVGSVGWCMGGMMSLQAAIALPDAIDATIIYYGDTTATPQELAPLQMPILGIFGGKDTGIPISGVRSFETALKTAQKKVEIVVYPEANHAFANPSGRNYRPQDAENAWQKTLTFFKMYLQNAN